MRFRPTEAVVDLSAIAHNHRLAVELGGRPAAGVVKANAYGHGAVPVARALLEAGAPLLAVAIVEEGLELRAAGIEAPVLVLGPPPDAAFEAFVEARLTPLVFTPGHVERLAAAARRLGARAACHLKLDTGMGRIGARPHELPAVIAALQAAPEVALDGLCTHFARADVGPREETLAQARRFAEADARLASAGLAPRLRHLSNSAGATAFPEVRQDLTRPGIMVYGYSPFEPLGEASPEARAAAARLRPALTWRTAIAHLKEVPAGTPISYGGRWVAARPSRIATLPVGYGDGYPRRLSGRPGMACGEVLLHGRRAPIAGTVCMDMTMVDVTDVPGAAVGDEVVLLGSQGAVRLGADELAARLGTISYEILTGIGARVPRVHVPASDAA